MDGVLVIDKPEGLTSHDVVAAARRALGERRIGHSGTLDPLATGVLPLACGRATRLTRFLTASTKDYEATIVFGHTTDTYDVTGRETGRSERRPDRNALERAIVSLTGDYLQMPPAFSAKKVSGTRAYDMARRDEPVELAASPVTVFRAQLLAFDGTSARVALTSSAGFYVRSFVHSLGTMTGAGACLQALRRTRSGEFTLAEAVSLQDLTGSPEDAARRALPLDRLLASTPAARLTDEGRRHVSHGQETAAWTAAHEPAVPSVAERSEAKAEQVATAGWVRLVDSDGHLVAMARPGTRPGFLHPEVVLI